MALEDHVHFRISKWESLKMKEYHWDASVIFRQAFLKKYRERVNDPALVIDEGESGPAAIYVQSWNRIKPVIFSTMSMEDFTVLRNSQEILEDLKRILSLNLMKPIEIQNLGIFLQGGDLSERLLMDCIDAELEEVKIP